MMGHATLSAETLSIPVAISLSCVIGLLKRASGDGQFAATDISSTDSGKAAYAWLASQGMIGNARGVLLSTSKGQEMLAALRRDSLA